MKDSSYLSASLATTLRIGSDLIDEAVKASGEAFWNETPRQKAERTARESQGLSAQSGPLFRPYLFAKADRREP